MDTPEQEALIEKTVARVLASAGEAALRNKTLTRAAFDAMSQADRTAHVRAGGKVTDAK